MKTSQHQSCASTTYPLTEENSSDALASVEEQFVHDESSPIPRAYRPISSSIAGDDDCTIVESIFTGHSVVPPPETVTPQVPECSTWAGAALAEAVPQEVPVALTQEKIVYKPVKQIVQRPVEHTTYVPKVIRKEVVEFKQVVTDEVIEVPKPYPVETKVYVPNYVDHDKCCVISQKYNPVLSQHGEVAVPCVRYEPEVRVVDIKVPKVVNNRLEVHARETKYVAVNGISKAQWNTLVFKLNPELCAVGDLTHLPVHRGPDGTVIAFKKDVPVGATLI